MGVCRRKLNMDVELMFRIRKLASLVIGLLTKTRKNPLGGGLVLALPVYLLFVCQFQLFAEATANETVILWSTVSPSGTYAFAHPKTTSTSSDSDKGAANGKPATELAIVNLQTKEPILDFSGFGATDFAPLDPLDASSTHWFCAWAPQEDHLLVVNALDPLACLQVDLPDGHVSNVGSTLVAAATRVANGPTTRKPSYSARSSHLSVIDAHFISGHECYVTVNIDSGSGSDARRVDLYFQINAGGNSLAFERSEPYPNPNQPLGASILASRQVERLYQTLRGVLNEGDRQLLTMQQQSWLGERELLDDYGDRVAFAQTRLAELRQRLKEGIQKKSAE
jgi:hypothetical protein